MDTVTYGYLRIKTTPSTHTNRYMECEIYDMIIFNNTIINIIGYFVTNY